MTRKEQIAEILAKYYLPPIKSMKDIMAMETWCNNTADEIIRKILLDVPTDEWIKNKYKSSPDNHLHPDRFREEGAREMREEILKRNK